MHHSDYPLEKIGNQQIRDLKMLLLREPAKLLSVLPIKADLQHLNRRLEVAVCRDYRDGT